MSSANLLPLILSPEAMRFIGGCMLLALYTYFGWYWPIKKIRDPNVKSKTGYIMLLLLIGIAPILVPLIIAVADMRRSQAGGAAAAAGTSFNASAGPQPVANANANAMRGALPVNRPPAAY